MLAYFAQYVRSGQEGHNNDKALYSEYHYDFFILILAFTLSVLAVCVFTVY